MDYKYNLAKLQYDKEKIEQLIALQTHHVGQTFPIEMEHAFWLKNLQRARKHIAKSFWLALLSYFIFVLVVIPSDYGIINRSVFAHDFTHCVLSIMNGGLCLLLLFCFAAQPKLQRYFLHASLLIMFWGIVSIAWLIVTVQTIELQHQAMAVIAIIYMLSYVISGIKPTYILINGLLAAIATLLLFALLHIDFDVMVLGRVMAGSCVFGYAIAHMIFARERMIFLYTLRARVSEEIHRIYNSELLHLSQHDALTTISNRRTFDEMMMVFYQQTRADQTALSILFIDIDYFKKYNDFYGHQKGDEVILAIAKAIKSAIRHMDFVARYGGEEFVVLLPATDAHGAYAVASNIYKAIDRLAISHANSLVSNNVTISLGITVYRGEEQISKEELLSIADQALYRAKQLGRNQIYYQSLRNTSVI